MGRIHQICLIFLGGLTLSLAAAFPSRAQEITRATIIEILDSDRVFIQNQKARLNSVAQRDQQVRTEQARAALRFNNNAAIRLGPNSSFIVRSRCVQLRQGRAIISGAVQGCVNSVIAATRGTIYVLEVNQDQSGEIAVLEGSITVSNLENRAIEPIILNAKQRVKISATGEIGIIEQFQPEEFRNLLGRNIFGDFQIPIANEENIDIGTPVLPANIPTPQTDSGFAGTFLQQAVSGSSDPLSSGSASSTVVPSSTSTAGIGSLPSPNPDAIEIPVTFTVLQYNRTPNLNPNFRDMGTFTDNLGNVTQVFVNRGDFPAQATISPAFTINGIPIAADPSTGTAYINGVAAREITFGLSGDDAILTIVGQDGTVFRAKTFGVAGREPSAGQSFPGVLIFGPAPDR